MQRYIIALKWFLWTCSRPQQFNSENILNNYSCCHCCCCSERLFIPVCWYCAIVFNIWGEVRSYSSVDFNGLICTHTLEYSLMSIILLKTSYDLVWIISFFWRLKEPLRSSSAALSYQKIENGTNFVHYCMCVCVSAGLCTYVVHIY